MRIALVIFTILTCAALQLQAQALESDSLSTISSSTNYYKRAYLGISYGFAIPMGTFSAKSISEGNSAYAENGSNFSVLEAGYRVRSNFYVSGKYMIVSNGVNEAQMEDELSKLTGLNYRISANDYSLRAVLLGAGLSKRSNILDVDLRFYMGYGSTFLPTFDVEVSDPQSGKEARFLQASERKSGLGGGLGLGLRFHLNEYIDFHSNATYFIFEKTFDEIQLGNQNTNASINLTYEALSINFGIAYRFLDDSLPKDD